jgi:predicted DCC family thiol-disulfide oxidoreductase YuxK
MAVHEGADAATRVLLFDGVCVFCNAAVRWLVARDPQARLRFASLQGETAAALRLRHPEIPEELDTFVLVERGESGERVFLRSAALFRLLAQLDSPWRHLALLRWLPRALCDAAYMAFARRRYRLFGRLDACRLPSADEAPRFLP